MSVQAGEDVEDMIAEFDVVAVVVFDEAPSADYMTPGSGWLAPR